MASEGNRRSRWVKGCAIGCAVLLLAAAGSCWVGVSLVKSMFDGLQRTEQSFTALEQELGPVESYTPPADGNITSERLRVFLAVREASLPGRAGLEATIADLPIAALADESTGGFERLSRGVGAVSDIVDAVALYLESRNEALREQHMGLGEYTYVYSIVYHSWLGHPPTEGPVVEYEGTEIAFLEDAESPLSPRPVQRRYRRHLLQMLRRQLSALEQGQPERVSSAARGGSAVEGAVEWHGTLAAEIRRFEDDPGRVVWQEGLPAGVADSLEPFREQLEAAYSRTCNPAELPFAKAEPGWGG